MRGGNLPPAVVEANLETEHAAEICMAAIRHGGFDAVHMYDHPAWQQVARVGGGVEVTWDQCTFADKPEKVPGKSTVWLAIQPILEPIRAYFSGPNCDHMLGWRDWMKRASG
ncbi:MAG: hypothetical protein SGPRY_013967 [Prymnesium sp.]